MTMTPEEIEALAQRTAALVIEPESVETGLVAASVSAPACNCQHAGNLEPAVSVTADAVARSDAPAALAPEDGMQPMPMWEAECVELKTRISALENRIAGLEADISRILIENTNLLTIG